MYTNKIIKVKSLSSQRKPPRDKYVIITKI